MTAKKRDEVHLALDELAEAANSLACHGAGGYSTDTSALDAVFLRCLGNLREALTVCDEVERYDPYGDLYSHLTR